jgi:uncharacterized protein with GYD domain
MPTYISLVNWTEQGIRDLKETAARADATAELAESLGGKLVQLYWTVGPYDLVGIFEAPDDETAATSNLRSARVGPCGRRRCAHSGAKSSRESSRRSRDRISQACLQTTGSTRDGQPADATPCASEGQ